MENELKRENILFRGTVLSGGAPKSSFQYIRVLKSDGCYITGIVQTQEKELKDIYEKTIDYLAFADDPGRMAVERRYFSLFKQMHKEYIDLKNNKPDFVVILGHITAFFYSRFCNSLKIPSVTLIAGGDLSAGISYFYGCPYDHVICFSEENRDVLLKCIDDERITVISNRIQLKTVFHDAQNYYNLLTDNMVNILFTSRVDNDKLDSITSFISLVDKISNSNRRVRLSVAGNGECFEKLKKYVDSINNPYLNVELKGHIDNLIPEFEKAHIVVGKGRSVIEPIMMNRIGCVMGNDGKIEVCTTENFEHLYHYNFSGRNLNCNNPEAVLKNLIDSMMSGVFDTDEMLAVADITRKHYSSEYLDDKFHYVLDNIKCEKRRKKRVSVLWLVLKLIWIKSWIKIKRRNTK